MRALVFSDGGPESQAQIDILHKVATRFPDLDVVVAPFDSDEAIDAGILVAPGLVIDGVTLSIGRALSAGRIRRFIEQHKPEDDA
ncbi:MAG TPA: hypothetical protein PLD23_04035 [Armatimonadota bacterium]|nr:hypothetical protein [Armatimonadota bacterium]